jgi:MYXO-CTERM domain-containing protein
MLISLLFLATAQADSLEVDSDYVLSVSDVVKYEINGNWSRVYPVGDDLYFFHAGGGDYWKILLDENLQVDNNDRTPLTGRNDLDDHIMVPCPDGGYLQFGSGGLDEDSDFAYTFRYDSNFNLLDSSILGEANPTIRFNDMAGICHEEGVFGAFLDYQIYRTMMYVLNDNGEYKNKIRVAELPIAEGASMLKDPSRGDLALVTSTPSKDGLYVNWMTWDLVFQGSKRILDVPVGEGKAYWPQGHVVVEDRILLSYILQSPVADGEPELEFGNLWVAIFDLEWNLLENLKLTHDDNPGGTMRPSMTLIEDTVYLAFDQLENFPPGDIQPRLLTLKLDLDAFVDPADSGSGSSDTGPCPDDSGGDGTGVEPTEPSCGCSQGPNAPATAGWPLLFGLLAFGRRRKRS